MTRPLETRSVLIVEDERIVALDLEGALRDLGYRVVGTAASAVDALAQAARERPDLVLMDIRLHGEIDGIQAAARLRSLHDVPVVYLTANADAATIARALETEPVGYLAKPYSQRTLRTTIEVALRRHTSEQAARQDRDEERRKYEDRAKELVDLVERLRHESSIDPLTGLYNRRHLDAAMAGELSMAERSGHALGLILVDLDNFKGLNDTFGHTLGDTALRSVANLLRSRLRPYDIPCRYGGEEIVIVVPAASLQDTARLAERLRLGVERLALTEGGGQEVKITASFGVSAFPEHGWSFDQLFRAADEALYRAKSGGRNQVVVAVPTASSSGI